MSLAPSSVVVRLGLPLLPDEIRRLGDGDLIVRDGVLGSAAAAACREAAEALVDAGALAEARIGRRKLSRPFVRGDQRAFLSEVELPPPLAELWAGFDALRLALNQGAWMGLRRFEVQLARFPGDGARYVRHLDAFRDGPSRRVTAIYYLNDGWRPDHGGQLRAWTPAGEVDVAPVADRLLLFRSECLPHAVLPTFAPRMALTAWFRGAEPVPLLADPRAAR